MAAKIKGTYTKTTFQAEALLSKIESKEEAFQCLDCEANSGKLKAALKDLKGSLLPWDDLFLRQEPKDMVDLHQGHDLFGHLTHFVQLEKPLNTLVQEHTRCMRIVRL